MKELNIFHSSVRILFHIIFFCILAAKVAEAAQISKNPEDMYESSFELKICDKSDENSNKYCDCSSQGVVSCDFSSFSVPGKSKKQSVYMNLIASWEDASFQRFCLCGAPTFLEVSMTSKFLANHYMLSRIDIYKMDGPINVPLDFKINFAGDIYFAKVKFFKEMGDWEFGRGRSINWTDTEEFKCCSNISSPKLTTPAFFMEDTTVGLVRNNAINSEHVWNTVVFNRVTFQAMESYAIRLDKSDKLNASFTNCLFQNLANASIAVDAVVNFLIAHSKFEETCSPGAVGARDRNENSVVALIGNTFLGPTLLEVDGETVAIWFNRFGVWDYRTFSHFGVTKFTDRTVSIEYNTIGNSLLEAKNFPELRFGDSVTLNQNVISTCDCSEVAQLTKLPALMGNSTANRCEYKANSRHCHLKIKTVQEECEKTSSPNLEKICESDEGDFVNPEGWNLTEVQKNVKALNVRIDSTFMHDMLNFVNHSFHIPEINNRSSLNPNPRDKSGQLKVDAEIAVYSVALKLQTSFVFILSVFVIALLCEFD